MAGTESQFEKINRRGGNIQRVRERHKGALRYCQEKSETRVIIWAQGIFSRGGETWRGGGNKDGPKQKKESLQGRGRRGGEGALCGTAAGKRVWSDDEKVGNPARLGQRGTELREGKTEDHKERRDRTGQTERGEGILLEAKNDRGGS